MVRNTHGFTVLELCCTLMIVAVLAAASTPHVTRLLGSTRLQGAGQAVWADLHRARLMAIKENRPIRVDFGTTSYSLVRVNTAEEAFSRQVALQYPGVTLSVTPNTLTFTSAGLLSGAARLVQIQSAHGTKSLTVLPTGRIGPLS